LPPSVNSASCRPLHRSASPNANDAPTDTPLRIRAATPDPDPAAAHALTGRPLNTPNTPGAADGRRGADNLSRIHTPEANTRRARTPEGDLLRPPTAGAAAGAPGAVSPPSAGEAGETAAVTAALLDVSNAPSSLEAVSLLQQLQRTSQRTGEAPVVRTRGSNSPSGMLLHHTARVGVGGVGRTVGGVSGRAAGASGANSGAPLPPVHSGAPSAARQERW
jgi:hypothetical protein